MPMPFQKYRPYDDRRPARPHLAGPRVTSAPIWCSTDLRDGNQALVDPMDAARKQKVLRPARRARLQGDRGRLPLGVEDRLRLRPHARRGGPDPRGHDDRGADAGAAGADRADVEAIDGARRAIVHLYNSTSETQRRVVFRLDRAGITELAVRGAALCSELAGRRDATSSSSTRPRASTAPSSTTRSRSARRCRRVGADADGEDDRQPADDGRGVPAERLRRPDRVVRAARLRATARSSRVHPHNDRGTAVATAELGLMAGAERVEGTLFGNGERTGNVDLVTLALNLFTQGVDPELDLSQIDEARRSSRSATSCRSTRAIRTSASSSTRRSRARTRTRSRRGWTRRSARARSVWDVPYLPIDPKDVGRTLRGDHPRQLAVGEGRRRVPDGDGAPPRAAARAPGRLRAEGAGDHRRARRRADRRRADGGVPRALPRRTRGRTSSSRTRTRASEDDDRIAARVRVDGERAGGRRRGQRADRRARRRVRASASASRSASATTTSTRWRASADATAAAYVEADVDDQAVWGVGIHRASSRRRCARSSTRSTGDRGPPGAGSGARRLRAGVPEPG